MIPYGVINLPNKRSLSSLLASRLSFFNCFSISWFIRFCSFASSLRQHAMIVDWSKRLLRDNHMHASHARRLLIVPPCYDTPTGRRHGRAIFLAYNRPRLTLPRPLLLNAIFPPNLQYSKTLGVVYGADVGAHTLRSSADDNRLKCVKTIT